jgi:hypothetical protein
MVNTRNNHCNRQDNNTQENNANNNNPHMEQLLDMQNQLMQAMF